MKTMQRARADEHGQILIMVALWAVALFGLCGLALDVGLMFVARAELRRDVDAAALASIVELPNNANVLARATEYLAANDPDAVLDPIGYNVPATGQITLSATKLQPLVFMPLVPGVQALLVGGTSISVSGSAVAGAGTAIDVGIVLDDTGTMRSGCNAGQTNSTCPIKQARDGANALVGIVGVGDGTGVAKGALINFRGCFSDGASRYNPITGEAPERGCIIQSEIVNLTTNNTTLSTGIADSRAEGGYPGTNICLGLYEAGQRILTGPGARAGARKVLVILTDADNRYSDGAESSSRGNSPNPGGAAAPPVYPSAANPQWPTAAATPTHTCRPNTPTQNSTAYGSDYDTRMNLLDSGAMSVVTTLEASGVEVFVVAYGVVGTPSGTLCVPANVGGGTARDASTDTRDRNFAKCIASSTPGTNDHYFESPAPADISTSFTAIGKILTTRLLK